MTDTQRRRGRPSKPAEPGERVSLGLRVTAEMKERLEAAAAASGRSQSQEAEFRLERSFVDDEMFSSRAVHMWAILKADEFHKSGVDAAAHASVDTADAVWMKDPSCLASASFAVIDELLRDMERQPGADQTLIDEWFDQLAMRFKHRIGKLRFFDEDGNEMKSGFVERNPSDAR